jgi:putative ABC transport system permease protein
MDALLKDLRFGLRALVKDGRFTILSILALAIGIGATTVVFSVVYNLMLNPFPYREPRRLVTFSIENLENFNGISARNYYWPAEYRVLRDQTSIFQDVVAYEQDTFYYNRGDGTRQFRGAWVTPNTFEFYGVAPLLGRELYPTDIDSSSPPVFVMSYKTWQVDFQGDPKIIGKVFTINGTPRTLVGIMPKRFNICGASMWAPRNADEAESLILVGRLNAGISLRTAATELNVLVYRLLKNEPHPSMAIRTLIDGALGDFAKMLRALLVAVLMLLLIACSNVANLLLARATVREREFGIRAAIGASRLQLIQQLLVESFLLSLSACIAGCGLAYLGLKAVVLILPADTTPQEAVISLNPIVLTFALGLTIFCTLVCGMAPALRILADDLHESLMVSGKGLGGGSRHGKIRSGLVIVEVGLSVVLLIGGGLMMRSLFALTHVDLPFNPSKLLYVELSLPRETYYSKPDKKPGFFDRVLPRVARLPGVVSVTETSKIPPNDWAIGTDVTIPGKPHADMWDTHIELCTEGYFETLELPLLKGRLLSENDIKLAKPVAIVNQTLARKYFGGEDPIGKKIKFQVFDRPFLDAPHDTFFEIVGLVPDFKRRPEGLKYMVVPEAFLPASVAAYSHVALLARTSVDPHYVLQSVLQQIWQVDPQVAFSASGSIDDLLKEENKISRFNSIILSTFAEIGLVLVIIGVYSVMTYTVEVQTHDIGVRMAMGAQRSSILRLILTRGVRLIALGIITGLVASIALTRFLASQLWGISPTDPITFAFVLTLIFFVGLIACFFPALRATRFDPLTTLREQ